MRGGVADLSDAIDEITSKVFGVDSYQINSNNGFIRYENGLQICWGCQRFTGIECTTALGNVYANESGSCIFDDFLAEFTSTPTITRSASGTWYVWVGTDSAQSTSKTGPGAIRIFRGVSTSNVEIYANYIAIGRWK